MCLTYICPLVFKLKMGNKLGETDQLISLLLVIQLIFLYENMKSYLPQER